MTAPAGILDGKILIVDDQEVNVLLLERMLRGAGYVAISSTRDPGEVCRLHAENRYDLILLDIQMPGMDGFQVMESLKALETDGYLPVLAITAQPGHKLRALREGAKDFISKPFDLAEVLIRVRNMLEVRLLHVSALNHRKELEALALNDPLTGLANRRMLDDRIAMALFNARRTGGAMALLYLDLDGFKQVNDTLGHGAGDALLKTIAQRLVATVREVDTVARVGGDEFMIALWEVHDSEHATAVALRVIEAVGKPCDIDGHALVVTTSVGISVYSLDGENADALIKNADLALYEAKRSGKNACRLPQRSAPPPGRIRVSPDLLEAP